MPSCDAAVGTLRNLVAILHAAQLCNIDVFSTARSDNYVGLDLTNFILYS